MDKKARWKRAGEIVLLVLVFNTSAFGATIIFILLASGINGSGNIILATAGFFILAGIDLVFYKKLTGAFDRLQEEIDHENALEGGGDAGHPPNAN